MRSKTDKPKKPNKARGHTSKKTKVRRQTPRGFNLILDRAIAYLNGLF